MSWNGMKGGTHTEPSSPMKRDAKSKDKSKPTEGGMLLAVYTAWVGISDMGSMGAMPSPAARKGGALEAGSTTKTGSTLKEGWTSRDG
jgi:hypothetical protein